VVPSDAELAEAALPVLAVLPAKPNPIPANEMLEMQ